MYEISIRRNAVKDLSNIASQYQSLISEHINGLAENPRPHDAKKLKIDAGYSLRVGVYRILYEIDDASKKITIFRIKHRKDSYK
jgi:mRNA interferase RelE/StbE